MNTLIDPLEEKEPMDPLPEPMRLKPQVEVIRYVMLPVRIAALRS
jgi:hypothetical protein